jgi:hypothetical protein
MQIDELERIAAAIGNVNYRSAPISHDAWLQANELVTPNDMIVITGSFFIAAELGSAIARSTPNATHENRSFKL